MDRKGFTLIEILIVIVILGVVASLSLPGLIKTFEKAKVEEATTNLDFIRMGQKRYFLSHGEFAENIGDLNIENPNDAASRYFDYSIDQDPPEGDFTARAQRKDTAPEPYNTHTYTIHKDGVIEGP